MLSYFSILRYFFELVMSNELLGQYVTVNQLWPGDPGHGSYKPVSGYMIVHDYLGFNADFTESCARVIAVGGTPSAQISACWYDLYIPALWFVAAVVLSIVLLKYVARDPH